MSGYSDCTECGQQLYHTALFCSCCRSVVCSARCLQHHVRRHVGDTVTVHRQHSQLAVFAVKYHPVPTPDESGSSS